MNKRTTFWLTAVSLGALVPATTLAADMPVKAAPIVAANFDWSGVYIGVHTGYGGGMKDWDNLQADFVARGFLGGGQVGINKQLSRFVFGLELDGSWADIKGSQTISIGGPLAGFTNSQTATSKIDGLLTIAGRAGLAADRWFVFAKGGLTMAHETHALNTAVVPNQGLTTTLTENGEDIRIAPMLGFGTEYALGGNWSIKGEYDYIHFGARAPTLRGSLNTGGAAIPAREDIRIDEAIHLVKLGVNYRFGSIATDPSYPSVPPAPGTNWSGGYVGVQAGYGWGSKQWPNFIGSAPVSYDVKGWLGGGTIGANAQAGAFVFGVEGEILGADVKGGVTTITNLAGISQTLALDSKIDWLALATARAGFVVGDRLMLYGKAGVAVADERHGIKVTQVAQVGNAVFNLPAKAVHTGAVVGAGGEYALGNNWSVKVEYDYIRMMQQQITGAGTETVNAPGNVGTVNFSTQVSKLTQDLQLVKVGLNYHFNPTPVVVARY